jgi:hypothetical protein
MRVIRLIYLYIYIYIYIYIYMICNFHHFRVSQVGRARETNLWYLGFQKIIKEAMNYSMFLFINLL